MKAKFIKIPKPHKNDILNTTQEELNQVFNNMIGYEYEIYLSEYNQEYVILYGTTEEAEKQYQDSIYKSLIAAGESEEYAKGVAYQGEEAEGCLYFAKECFEIKEEK